MFTRSPVHKQNSAWSETDWGCNQGPDGLKDLGDPPRAPTEGTGGGDRLWAPTEGTDRGHRPTEGKVSPT